MNAINCRLRQEENEQFMFFETLIIDDFSTHRIIYEKIEIFRQEKVS